jgi:hypothetical protein
VNVKVVVVNIDLFNQFAAEFHFLALAECCEFAPQGLADFSDVFVKIRQGHFLLSLLFETVKLLLD